MALARNRRNAAERHDLQSRKTDPPDLLRPARPVQMFYEARRNTLSDLLDLLRDGSTGQWTSSIFQQNEMIVGTACLQKREPAAKKTRSPVVFLLTQWRGSRKNQPSCKMASRSSPCYRVNRPKVVYEVFEDETVLINLDSG